MYLSLDKTKKRSYSEQIYTGLREGILSGVLAAGVYVVPVERHALVKGHHRSQILLGYAGLTEEKLAAGLRQIREICLDSEERDQEGREDSRRGIDGEGMSPV